jgi:uracil-DNA glycosylase family 4
MGADQHIDWTRAAASALDWWQAAGVDVLVEDEAFGWLSPAAAASPSATPLAAGALPDTVAAFAAWRHGPDAPEATWGAPLIPGSGPIDADLMILVDCPERDDRDCLLGGAAGRLFDRMLAAIGRSRADVRLAAVCAARPVAGRMPRETEARLAELARHHVALVAPERLLVLGNAASRALLSTELTKARGSLRALNHRNGKSTSVAVSFHPRFLLEKPACKADAWEDLQMLMGEQR